MAQEDGNSVKEYVEYYEHRDKALKAIDNKNDRFEPFSSRKDEGCWTEDFMKNFVRGKYQVNWKGVERMKDPVDIIIYEQMIWDIRPKTIIEIGTAQGGAAMWMADCLKEFEIDGKVVTFDINMASVHPKVKERKDIDFLEGDCYKVEEFFTDSKMKSLPHPWIIIEDAHTNILGVLGHFHQYMEPGDYLIVDDTSAIASMQGAGLLSEYTPYGFGKLNVLKEFMAKHGDSYAVDTKYCDWFGYNASFNWNGYLRRMK